MTDTVSNILAFLLLAILILLPGISIILSRVTIRQPFDKSVAYLCSEISLTPEKWPEKKKQIEAESSINIRAPMTTIFKGLLTPVFTGAKNLTAIWYALMLLLMLLMVAAGQSGLRQVFGSMFSAFFYFIMIVTVFLYYFRSVASDLYVLEERAAITAGFLVELQWTRLSDDMLKLFQEQIKTDHDVFKENTGLGGIMLIVFSASVLMSARLGASLPLSVAIPLVGLLSTTIFFKWVHESNRSRTVHIALNALIMVRKVALSEKEVGVNNSMQSTLKSGVADDDR